MMTNSHEQNRMWLLETLEYLENFSRLDEDYCGDRAYESKAVSYQHAVVRDGRYRVVFLGAFNVGKSTALNAFLGGSYLPMDIEECTSRLTFIQRGDRMQLLLSLDTAASRHEIEALERALAAVPVIVESEGNPLQISVLCQDQNPDSMRRALEPLITVLADEAFPHLSSLREKTESLILCLPEEALQDDLVLIDTPGVHSISETRQKITYDIIEHCHLVIAFVDSAFVGNIHDLNFIKRIITCRDRRVFFVLNKADKLENDEIDPRGTFGPAGQLVETFRRNDIPDHSDIFFLSGYRALSALELDQKRLSFEEALADNKLMLPTSILERLEHSDTPEEDLSAFLMGQSRFPLLKERLMDYLINENKSNAVFTRAARFVYERASDYLITISNTLALARNPEKFIELKENRDLLNNQMATIRTEVDSILVRYNIQFHGGQQDEVFGPGYDAHLRAQLTVPLIESEIIQPLLDWLRKRGQLKEIRQGNFHPLAAQLEHEVDVFTTGVIKKLRAVIETNEKRTSEEVSRQISRARELRAALSEPERLVNVAWDAAQSEEKNVFGSAGAGLNTFTGKSISSVIPAIGAAIGVGVGGFMGTIRGWVARFAWSEERWIKKIMPVLRQETHKLLMQETQEESASESVLTMLLNYSQRRGEAFEQAMRKELEHVIETVQQECESLLSREMEIRREQDTIIERLKPKEAKLQSIRERAEVMAEEDPETSI